MKDLSNKLTDCNTNDFEIESIKNQVNLKKKALIELLEDQKLINDQLKLI